MGRKSRRNLIVEKAVVETLPVINIETKIVKEVNNQTLDDFEAEYQAFIADLKAKKEREKEAKQSNDFEAEYEAFVEELKMMKEQNETSTEETIVQD